MKDKAMSRTCSAHVGGWQIGSEVKNETVWLEDTTGSVNIGVEWRDFVSKVTKYVVA